MGLLVNLLTLPVMGPIKGLIWIAEKAAEQAEREAYNEDNVRGQLMELELRLDLGEITEEEYAVAEEELLARLRVAREHQAEQ
jgi:hypothetical protein